ncbi:MAG: YqiA/YcfP family alpha/beta fold hydrolase [Burkholderiales bacterium]
MLIYIHGFNSAPASFKARLVGERMRALGRENEYFVPALPHRPVEAMALLRNAVEQHPGAALIGSSLGGFYATWLAEHYGLRAVLVNPAVRPYELLRGALGPQKNLYTGATYDLTAQHVEELKALDVAAITPERYMLLTRTGDEVLDYRLAVEKYYGARQWVIPGGDHGFADFENYLDAALAFCGIAG